MTTDYDVIVIGAGSTGENVADRVVQGGLTAALVESELVGGDCSYWACMPSKALLRSGEALDAARRVPGAAEAITGPLDVAATLARRDSFTSHWSDDGQVSWAQSHHIDVIRGHGRLTGARSVQVTAPDGSTRELSARHAVAVCTGSAPALPPVPGLAGARPWTTRQITSAPEPPTSMIVLGGGVAGCEMAQAWSSLGSMVTLVEMASRLLPQHEPFAGELVARGLADKGVRVLVDTSARSVQRAGDGPTTVRTGDGELVADVLLVSTGRTPRAGDIGLESVGVDGDTWISVDDACRVQGVDDHWLYAVGDVNGRALLTHQGKYQARACGTAILAAARGVEVDLTPWSSAVATADHGAVPSVVFTDPQVAMVGRTEAQAREAGITVRTVEYDIGSVAGAALTADGYTGHAKLVVDESRRVIVGATLVGAGVGELIHAATVAVVGQVPLERLWHAVPAYPTVSELWLRLLEAYGL